MDLADPERAPYLGEQARGRGAATIGHFAFHDDAALAEPAQGTRHEAGGSGALSIRQGLDIGQAGRIIDGGANALPACAGVEVALALPSDAITWLFESFQLLDGLMDRLT